MNDQILINENGQTQKRAKYDGFDFNLVEGGIYSKSIRDKEVALFHIENFLQNSVQNNYAYGPLIRLRNYDIELSKTNPSQFILRISTRIANDIGSLIMSIDEHTDTVETILILILKAQRV